MENWGATVKRLQDNLDLTLPRFAPGTASEVDDFLDIGLRHQAQPAQKALDNPMFSKWVRDAFAVLERWANGREAPADYATLDGLRGALDNAASTFGPVIAAAVARKAEDVASAEEIELLRSQNEELQASLAQTKSEQQQSEEAAEEVRVAETKIREELDQVKSALEQRSHEAEQTHRELGVLKAEKTDHDRRLVEMKSDLALSRKELEQETQQVDTLKRRLVDETTKVAALDSKLSTQYREMADLSRILRDEEEKNQAQIATLTHRSEFAESAYDMVTKSTSWRLTRPLRWLVRLVRR
ncbi:hypothetical protein [Sulfitobacter aestuariivivens]